MSWRGTHVLVTGGASFIGSALVDALVEREALVRVVDNLASGRLHNLQRHLAAATIEYVEADLLDAEVARRAVQNMTVVFHLADGQAASACGGRLASGAATNLALDALVFHACLEAGVDKVVFASSERVYPGARDESGDGALLTESQAGPPYDAAGLSGWTKLMGELTLQTYYREHGLRSVSCRYGDTFGARGRESHPVLRWIAQAFVRRNPVTVWGTGHELRSWTHVDDIVQGTLLAAETIGDGSAVNLGTAERVRVIDAVHEILRYTGHDAQVTMRPDICPGGTDRGPDSSLARRLFGWRPHVRFADGLHRTIDWYFSNKTVGEANVMLREVSACLPSGADVGTLVN